MEVSLDNQVVEPAPLAVSQGAGFDDLIMTIVYLFYQRNLTIAHRPCVRRCYFAIW